MHGIALAKWQKWKKRNEIYYFEWAYIPEVKINA